MASSLKNETLGIVVTHNPPTTIYDLLGDMLNLCWHVIVVDSSENEWFSQTDLLNNENLVLIQELKNMGLGHALNTAIDIGAKFSPRYILIVEDDAMFVNLAIVRKTMDEFFTDHYSNDVIYLADHSTSSYEQFIPVTHILGTNSGIFMKYELARTVSFREDFFMDQIDVDFQYRVKKMGGKIYMTGDQTTARLPIGRTTKDNCSTEMVESNHTIATWRYYLLTRNSLTLFLEGAIGLTPLFYIIGYFFKGLLIGQKIRALFSAAFHGVIDSINHNLGITEYLTTLRPDLSQMTDP